MKKIVFLIAIAVVCVACERTPIEEPEGGLADPTASARILVLDEGSWGNNNADISLIDTRRGTIEACWFSQVNQRGLGDVAQDIVLYGSKLYATVTFSNSLEVIDPRTGLSARVDMGDREPRYIVADGGKLYISCYRPHSVVCVDTATLQVEKVCLLGQFNPEGVAMAGGKLLVASSYVQTENGDFLRDTLLYVLNPTTMQIEDSLMVGLNPQLVVAIDDRYVAVNYSGDYTDGTDGTAIVDLSTMTVGQMNVPLTGMCCKGGLLYGFSRVGYGSNSTATYYTFDPYTTTLAEIPISIGTPYGIGVDPANSGIYVADDGNYTANGIVYGFRPDGSLRGQGEASRLPKKFIFLND